MALLHTISSVVRLPLRAAGKAAGVVTALLPGHGAKTGPSPAPTDTAPPAATPAGAAPVTRTPAKGPVEPASTGPTPDPAAPAPAKKAPAKKAAAKKAPTAKATPAKKAAPPAPEPEPTPVTAIDAEALDDEVDVTPADIAQQVGTQLDDRPPSPS